ncbi:MAG: hypothetical protein WEB58_07720 [Planctomycetaceae bacterium]
MNDFQRHDRMMVQRKKTTTTKKSPQHEPLTGPKLSPDRDRTRIGLFGRRQLRVTAFQAQFSRGE